MLEKKKLDSKEHLLINLKHNLMEVLAQEKEKMSGNDELPTPQQYLHMLVLNCGYRSGPGAIDQARQIPNTVQRKYLTSKLEHNMIRRKFKGRLMTEMEMEEHDRRMNDRKIIRRLEQIRRFQQEILDRRIQRAIAREDAAMSESQQFPALSEPATARASPRSLQKAHVVRRSHQL